MPMIADRTAEDYYYGIAEPHWDDVDESLVFIVHKDYWLDNLCLDAGSDMRVQAKNMLPENFKEVRESAYKVTGYKCDKDSLYNLMDDLGFTYNTEIEEFIEGY